MVAGSGKGLRAEVRCNLSG